MFPLAAFAAAALVAWTPPRFARRGAFSVIAIGLLRPWVFNPHMEAFITWKESQVNSVARRDWTNEAAEFLRSRYRPGNGRLHHLRRHHRRLFRRPGIPLRDTLNCAIRPDWLATVDRRTCSCGRNGPSP